MGFAEDFPDIDEANFPALATNAYRVRSQATAQYNCLAWAASDNKRWWEPDDPDAFRSNDRDYYWPLNSAGLTILEAIKAYRILGFKLCADGNKERGIEKIAIYADDAGPTHAARQRGNGWWTSKLGKSRDIDHRSTDALNGPGYGRVVRYMCRPKKLRRASKRTSKPSKQRG